MITIDSLINDYTKVVVEGSNWEISNFAENELQNYWENLLNSQLSQYGFLSKVIINSQSENNNPTAPLPQQTVYYSSNNSVELIINKNEIAQKFNVDNLPPQFDENSELVANTIQRQLLNVKYQKLSTNYGERIKELAIIRQASLLLGHDNQDMKAALSQICESLPNAMQYPQYAVARIKFGDKVFKTKDFEPCGKGLIKKFECAENVNGSIEVYYKKHVPNKNLVTEDQFLIEEYYMLNNLAVMITGASFYQEMKKFRKFNSKRMSELETINKVTAIIKEGHELAHTLRNICHVLPNAMQYPQYACARIIFDSKEYVSNNFELTHRYISEQFVSFDSNKGQIEVYYTKDLTNDNSELFLKEESNLLTNIARLITGYINDIKGRDIIFRSTALASFDKKEDTLRRTLKQEHKPLQNYFNQQMLDKYIYLDMMKFKVKHVLFVATLYDAFCLENEDSFFGRFMGDVQQFSLYTMPRITGVSSAEDAIEVMQSTNIDLIIIMPVSPASSLQLSEKLCAINNTVPIYLLVNKKEETLKYGELASSANSISKVFTWNGDSNIFFTIVKSLEDSINVENDTEVGLVKVILLIEDSPLYYSRYLELLYNTVFDQIGQLVHEVEKNELDKIVKMRSRPKILHARNYEEAISIFNKYKNHLMCVISDIEIDWGGKPDKRAGISFVKHIRSMKYTVPVIFQSTEEPANLDTDIYREEKVFFVNKNSESLLDELKRYLIKYLGFGGFVFKNLAGDVLGTAHSLREFETMLKEMPTESIYRHAIKNQFSIWLMGRGEIQLAKIFNGLQTNSIDDIEKMRPTLINTINKYRAEKKRGKILSFDETSSIDERNIVTLAPGSLGGKGRGIAFIDTVIYNIDATPVSDRINILAPVTLVVGTEEFTNFIEQNNLFAKTIDKNISYEDLKLIFWNSDLSSTLIERIRAIIKHIDTPLAIRSSSTSEDSVSQPFAGVFSTFMIPNGKDNKEETLKLVCQAIKLIYASMYSDTARNYYNAVHHNISEEKMAIVIQEVVGSKFGNYFYPHISGVAQSYNFYPVADMKPEEGYAVAGVGLGCYVVGGWPSYRFSPKYPQISMYTKTELLKSTQTKFYALDLSNKNVDLLKNGELAALKLLNISEAERHGSLKHLVSVYNADNDTISPGLDEYGARIVNFANVLEYNYFPLAETISMILNAVKDAFGSAVEIEYAVNLNKAANGKPSFYLLQIKPMVGSFEHRDVNLEDKINSNSTIMYTNQSLGNGIIETIEDIIYIDETKFNKLETVEMKREINYLNTLMSNENRKYVLIGPGRWGTSDRFLGVPVQWSEISNAAVIIETSLEGYPLDFSHGSHFFHNITSMNIGYFAVKKENPKSFIRRNILENQTLIQSTKYFKHIRFNQPLKIVMNGGKNESAIFM